jgi:hypothetical protein
MVFFASFLLATIVYMPEGIAVKIQTLVKNRAEQKSFAQRRNVSEGKRNNT